MANAASAALIGYYGLNETPPSGDLLKGLTAVDSSGNGRDGTYAGEVGPKTIPSVNAGLYGTAMSLDSSTGQTGYVDLVPFSDLTQTGAFTYAAWLNPAATQLANPTVIGNLQSSSRGYDLRIAASGSNWSLKLTAGASPAVTSTLATISSGVWTHVAVTKDTSNNIQFYVNGSLVDSGTIGLTSATAPSDYYIGAGQSGTAYFAGGIDEVRIYNEVLSGSAIAGLAVVPEPTSILLMGVGSLGLIGYRLRKRN